MTKKRISWNKGLTKKTDERVLAYSKKLKIFWTKERRIEQGNKIRGNKNPSKRFGHPFKGKKHTLSTKRKMSDSKNKLINTGWKTWMTGRHHTEETIKIIKEKRANQHFPHTSIEIKMENMLKSLNIKYQTHKSFNDNSIISDFFIEPNIVIECDGDYWHNRLDMKKKDKRNNKWFKENDYIILRFWESEINNKSTLVLKRINKILNDKRNLINTVIKEDIKNKL